ncbi:hypothetical protein BH11CYA1_BH11CYA1_24060 [soil metagenome]
MAGDRERCLNLGMDDYVSKPYNLDDLAICLAKWLVGAKAHFERQPEGLSQDSEYDDALCILSKLSERFTAPQVRELVTAFLLDTSERIKLMRSRLLSGDLVTAGGNAHAMRGATSILAMPSLAEHCREIEIACLALDQECANVNFLRFVAQFESLRAELQKIQF